MLEYDKQTVSLIHHSRMLISKWLGYCWLSNYAAEFSNVMQTYQSRPYGHELVLFLRYSRFINLLPLV